MRISPAVRRTASAAGAGVGTAGLLSGVLLLGPLAATVLLLIVFLLVWPLAAAIQHVSDDAPFTSPVVAAASAAGAVLCLPGIIRLLAWGAAGLLVAAAVGALFAVIDLLTSGRWFRRRRHSPSYGELTRLSRSVQREGGGLAESIRCPLSTEELCGVWCETSTALMRDGGVRDRQTVADVRRICLDEFERRNPDGFHRWIEAGAPANPTRYLLPDRAGDED